MIKAASHRLPLSVETACAKKAREAESRNRWAIILAGGDGTRLRSLTRRIAGDERPKQFCPILGDETLLDQTRRRVALSIPFRRMMFVLTEAHERFYAPLVKGVPARRLVVQPRNQGTAPAILYSLLRLAALAPDATVAFFPSDHYLADDETFMSHVETAFRAVHVRPETVVLLGIKPTTPEAEYGWIEPVASVLGQWPSAVSQVQRFWEKPAPDVARGLMERGCLWNSFVMVGRVSSFLELMGRATPELFEAFRALRSSFNRRREKLAASALYDQLPEINFSHEVLAARPMDLAVLSVTADVGWSDWGEPQRVLSTLAEIGVRASWAA